jgi:hypothetical protein
VLASERATTPRAGGERQALQALVAAREGAVDEAGRPLAEEVIVVGSEELLAWAAALDEERLWAVEDCRQLTRWLERQLLGVGEEVVRVPPKLTVPERRVGRTRGKSEQWKQAYEMIRGMVGSGELPETAYGEWFLMTGGDVIARMRLFLLARELRDGDGDG